MAVTIAGPKEAPKKKPGRMGMGGKIAAACVAAALLASGTFLVLGLGEYKDMRDMVLTWTELAELAAEEDPEAPPELVEVVPDGDGGMTATTKQVAAERETDWLYKPVNLKALREINADVTGYIYIPGTKVDYPILKETTPEAYYYINHNMYKAYDQYGSIFELCDEERGLPDKDNPVSWLFGHHMSSGSMFATLYSYEDPDFYDTPVYVYRDDWRAEYQVVGYCHLDMHDQAYAFDAYSRNDGSYEGLLAHLKENNLMQAERSWPEADDDMLLLSTCYGSAGTRWRMLLVCREVRRAMVPEYYESLQEVEQYGGDETPVEKPRRTAGSCLSSPWRASSAPLPTSDGKERLWEGNLTTGASRPR